MAGALGIERASLVGISMGGFVALEHALAHPELVDRLILVVTSAGRRIARGEEVSTADDDRVLPETRWAALVVFIILVPAVIILWGTPGETAKRWAWTIKPDLTPIFLGAGYGAGAYFFWRTFRARRWHPSSAGVLGASAFAALMLIATLIHRDRFNHGDAPFLAARGFTVGAAGPLCPHGEPGEGTRTSRDLRLQEPALRADHIPASQTTAARRGASRGSGGRRFGARGEGVGALATAE